MSDDALTNDRRSTDGVGGLPLVVELSPCPPVEAALRAFADQPAVLLLDSALVREPVGRYSFLTADPFDFFELQRAGYGLDPFAAIRPALAEFSAPLAADLPPFQGGAAGLLSYELGRSWERLPRSAADEFGLPDMAVGLYDWTIAWDHATGRAWAISQGFPEARPNRRSERAAARMDWVLETLEQQGTSHTALGRINGSPSMKRISAGRLYRQFPLDGPPGLTSNFSRDEYLQAVERVIDYIFAGDIFQANLSQRLLARFNEHPVDLYARLRRCNPAPFAGYFAHQDWAVASASPERFLCIRGGEVETRPIKGTRRRPARPEADLFTRDELRESEKDQAENLMIVDLLRNDLSRVCTPGTIRVPHFCSVETYETVQHLVTEIRGNLAAGRDAWDLLAASFPGGSITGAPKVRAMQIIDELEPTARGPYCGSLFYVGYDGQMDSSILIRTFTCRGGWLQCPVGGGIVAQSTPEDEYAETLHKAAGMLRAIRSDEC